MRNQFKPINTFAQSYDYIITLIWRGNKRSFLSDNGMFLIYKTLNPLCQRMLCWNWLGGSGEGYFISSMNFCYFVITSPWKRTWSFIWINWIPFTQGWLLPSLVEIGPVVLEKKIFKFVQCIFAISYLSPLEKVVALYLNKLESPSPKNALYQVWLKLTQWFFRRGFLDFF